MKTHIFCTLQSRFENLKGNKSLQTTAEIYQICSHKAYLDYLMSELTCWRRGVKVLTLVSGNIKTWDVIKHQKGLLIEMTMTELINLKTTMNNCAISGCCLIKTIRNNTNYIQNDQNKEKITDDIIHLETFLVLFTVRILMTRVISITDDITNLENCNGKRKENITDDLFTLRTTMTRISEHYQQ